MEWSVFDIITSGLQFPVVVKVFFRNKDLATQLQSNSLLCYQVGWYNRRRFHMFWMAIMTRLSMREMIDSSFQCKVKKKERNIKSSSQWQYFGLCDQADGKLDIHTRVERTKCIVLMAELRRATFYINCKRFYQIVFVHVWWFHAPLPACAHHHTFVETCKQPRVYQFPVVILSPSVPSLHMIIDRIKRGPFNGVEGIFDLHSHSGCNGVPLMQWNLSLAQGGVEGERRAFLFFW